MGFVSLLGGCSIKNVTSLIPKQTNAIVLHKASEPSIIVKQQAGCYFLTNFSIFKSYVIASLLDLFLDLKLYSVALCLSSIAYLSGWVDF